MKDDSMLFRPPGAPVQRAAQASEVSGPGNAGNADKSLIALRTTVSVRKGDGSTRRKSCSLAVLAALSLQACQCLVTVPSKDTTGPTLTMDVYGLRWPPDPGNPPEEVSFGVGCCSISRPIALGQKLTLLAVAEDPESGTASVAMNARIVILCSLPNHGGYAHTDTVVIGESHSGVAVGVGSIQPYRLAAQGDFSVTRDYWTRACGRALSTPLWLSVEIFAVSRNGLDVVSTTQQLSLFYPTQSPPP